MSYVLRIDAGRWRTHLSNVAHNIQRASGSAVVPVVKGNGYGLGQELLAREVSALDVDVVAVGTVFELDEVMAATLCDVVVLEPFEPRDAVAAEAWWHASQRWDAARIIRTVSSADALRALSKGDGEVRVVVEGLSSVHRFGMAPDELQHAMSDSDVRSAVASGRLRIDGLSLHLPIAQPGGEPHTEASAKVAEVMRWVGRWKAELQTWRDLAPTAAIWVSHLNDDELAAVAAVAAPGVVRVRVGGRLWLDDRHALRPQATVLAVHPVDPSTYVGYRQRTGPRDGTLVVLSGGTRHGIGLTAPSPAASLRQRVVTAGTGVVGASGRALSPFVWEGKQRWFAESPHQHHSMVWLPRGVTVPQVGDTFAADVRFTTAHFDDVILD